jgi:hypothetical protein
MGLERALHELVDFPSNQEVFLARPGIDGDGRLRGCVQGARLFGS